jgi:hypothetical protein
MMDPIPISFKCPPMAITGSGLTLRMTAAEPMLFVANFPATDVVIDDVMIPETPVKPKPHHPLHWQVAQCEAEKAIDGLYVKVTLWKEDVDIHVLGGYAIAQPVPNCPVVFMNGGDVYDGLVNFPECRVPLGGLAAAVTATGTMTKRAT